MHYKGLTVGVLGNAQKIAEREKALHESPAVEAAHPTQLDALLHALDPAEGAINDSQDHDDRTPSKCTNTQLPMHSYVAVVLADAP